MKNVYIALLAVVGAVSMSACIIEDNRPRPPEPTSCNGIIGDYDTAVSANLYFDPAGYQTGVEVDGTPFVEDSEFYVSDVYDEFCGSYYDAFCSGGVTFTGCANGSCGNLISSDETIATLTCSYLACDGVEVAFYQDFKLRSDYYAEGCFGGFPEPLSVKGQTKLVSKKANSVKDLKTGQVIEVSSKGTLVMKKRGKNAVKATAEKIKKYEGLKAKLQRR